MVIDLGTMEREWGKKVKIKLFKFSYFLGTFRGIELSSDGAI